MYHILQRRVCRSSRTYVYIYITYICILWHVYRKPFSDTAEVSATRVDDAAEGYTALKTIL